MSQFFRNPFFGLTAVLGLTFIVTIFAMVATMFGDPLSPMNQFLDRSGGTLMTVEVIGILAAGLLAMGLDRWQTLHEAKQNDVPESSRDTPST